MNRFINWLQMWLPFHVNMGKMMREKKEKKNNSILRRSGGMLQRISINERKWKRNNDNNFRQKINYAPFLFSLLYTAGRSHYQYIYIHFHVDMYVLRWCMSITLKIQTWKKSLCIRKPKTRKVKKEREEKKNSKFFSLCK